GAADVAERAISREIELLGERREIGRRDAAHRVHKLLQACGVAVELVEHRYAGALELVLRPAAPERFGELTPERVEAGIRHLEEAPDVARASPVEEGGGLRRVAIACRRAVAVPLEEPECDERIREVRYRARMKPDLGTKLLGRLRRGTQRREDAELDRREQNLRRPEPHADLEEALRCESGHATSWPRLSPSMRHEQRRRGVGEGGGWASRREPARTGGDVVVDVRPPRRRASAR